MKRWIPISLAALALASCAGTGDLINDKLGTARGVAKEAANVVEESRCQNRPIGVLAEMVAERGAEWSAGFMLSCPNLKPLLEAAKAVPSVTIE